jgi:DoxX
VTRWNLLKYTLCAAMLCGFMLSPKLWLTARNYPQVPVWDRLPDLPTPWDWLVLGLLLVTLGAIVGGNRPRLALLMFVALAAIWSLWDQTRWQPWFYQYLFMFAALACGSALDNPERSQASLNTCRLIIVGTYFWSGLQKVNWNFAQSDFPWLMAPLLKHLPESWHPFIGSTAWAVAFAECAIGLGLLIGPLRPLAVIGAVSMHLLILYCLGPWGRGWNTVVWPWNVAMMVFVVVLFGRTRQLMPWQILWPRRFLFARLVLLLFGILPLLNFFDCWDSYLSAALYSGNTPDARIFISEDVLDQLPNDVKYHVRLGGKTPEDLDPDCRYEVDVGGWSMAELNVPSYPAERVYRGLARRLAQRPSATTDPRSGVRVVLLLRGRADWRTGNRRVESVVFSE